MESTWERLDDKQRDRSALRSLNQAKEYGLHAAATLDVQGEQLEQAEFCADSNQYMMDRSARLVRGMTWWGWLTNGFIPEPKPPAPQQRRRQGSPLEDDRRREGSRRRAPISAAGPRPIGGGVDDEFLRDLDNNMSARQSSHLKEQREYLDEVSQGLDELMEVGGEIGRRVEEQNESVPRLQDKIENLWQSTRHVTRQAGRVMESYATRATPKLLGHVALREVTTKRMVRARGDEVSLSDEVDCLRATCRFALYEKRAHLLGLQSPVSKNYVGLTFAGSIRCSARSFGRTEEFDFELHKSEPTPLLCVAANFGAGCWIRVESKERRLLPAEPRDAPDALQRAARFQVIFLDDNFITPSYAEQIIRPAPIVRPSPRSTSASGATDAAAGSEG